MKIEAAIEMDTDQMFMSSVVAVLICLMLSGVLITYIMHQGAPAALVTTPVAMTSSTPAGMAPTGALLTPDGRLIHVTHDQVAVPATIMGPAPEATP